jgi:hypothetical protein
MPRKQTTLPYEKKMDYVHAADRIDKIIGAIDLLADLLKKDDEFISSLRGSGTSSKVEQCVRELWNASDGLEDASKMLRKKIPKSC